MEKREKFSSRIGFILISAGCAIGIGNVWRFPFVTGQYGGAAFVLVYLFLFYLRSVCRSWSWSFRWGVPGQKKYCNLVPDIGALKGQNGIGTVTSEWRETIF